MIQRQPTSHFLRNIFWALHAIFLSLFYIPAFGIELDPFLSETPSRDPFSISFFREERPSFYWVNIGVPDVFFNNVQQNIQGSVGPTVYTIRSIEYGIKSDGWLTDQLQLRSAIPFEANALVDASGNPQNSAKFGDLQVGATYLLEGKRENGNFVGVDGWYRFATGSNPFAQAYPLLATGKGASGESLGILLGQEVDGFSFFQSVHYEKTQPISMDVSNSFFGAGTFQWPDYIHGTVRGEWQVLHRAQRIITLFYDLRIRMSGLMEFNHQALTYGQTHLVIEPQGLQPTQTTDVLLFSNSGVEVQVDKEFTAEGRLTFFPFEPLSIIGEGRPRPDSNFLFSLTLTFRPL